MVDNAIKYSPENAKVEVAIEKTDNFFKVRVKDNGMGFASWGARNGTYYANWIKSGKHLSGKHLEKARKMAMYHAGQLTNIANGVLGKA